MSHSELISDIVAGQQRTDDLPVDELAGLCETLNEAYRAGRPIVSDRQYDELFHGVLAQRAPDHPFLSRVEPEPEGLLGQGKVIHKTPMLSTNKAYTEEELLRFFARIERVAESQGIARDCLRYRATPKLDGIAGLDDGSCLASRGNGEVGSDLTFGIERGLKMVNGRGWGAGEIVVVQDYFESELRDQFGLEHPRNFVAGFFSADTVKPHHQAACEAGALQFVPYAALGAWVGDSASFMAEWTQIMARLQGASPYLTDGIVLELDSVDGDADKAKALRETLGSTSHHHRWQIAVKALGETRTARVNAVRAQTGRTGRVTPVLEIDPVRLEGSTITNVTAHTASSIPRLGLGVGAIITITRSGGVIPKLLSVSSPSDDVREIDSCPSCGHGLEEDGEYAVCVNNACPAQSQNRLIHWFKTLGTADLFGPATTSVLVEAGHIDSLAVYGLGVDDFRALGFGPGQSANLVAELERSQREEIPDWRWLAAAGIRHLGRGDSRRLLSVYSLDEVLSGLSPEQITAVGGFGPITSPLIADSLAEQGDYLKALLALGFRLRATRSESGPDEGSPVAGKHVVFTGAMESGSRDEMKERARSLGANVQSSVNGKTDFLVIGARVGARKMEAALRLVEEGKLSILPESEWLGLIGQAD
jgi:DNA ligase (NAD+)